MGAILWYRLMVAGCVLAGCNCKSEWQYQGVKAVGCDNPDNTWPGDSSPHKPQTLTVTCAVTTSP